MNFEPTDMPTRILAAVILCFGSSAFAIDHAPPGPLPANIAWGDTINNSSTGTNEWNATLTITGSVSDVQVVQGKFFADIPNNMNLAAAASGGELIVRSNALMTLETGGSTGWRGVHVTGDTDLINEGTFDIEYSSGNTGQQGWFLDHDDSRFVNTSNGVLKASHTAGFSAQIGTYLRYGTH